MRHCTLLAAKAMMQTCQVLCSEFSYDFIDNIFYFFGVRSIFISPNEHQMPRVKITLLVFKSEIKINLTYRKIFYFFYAKM